MRVESVRLSGLLGIGLALSLIMFVENVSAQDQKKNDKKVVSENEKIISQGEDKGEKAVPEKKEVEAAQGGQSKSEEKDSANNPYLMKKQKPAPQSEERHADDGQPPTRKGQNGDKREMKKFPNSDAVEKAMQRRYQRHHKPLERTRKRPPRRHGDAGAPIALAIAFGTVWNLDPGFELFSEDEDESPAWGGLWASYDVFSLTPKLILAAELGFWIGGSENHVEELDSAYFSYHESRIHVGANLRYVLVPWFQPHARLEIGPSFVTLESSLFENADSDGLMEDTVSPFASLGAGVTFRTPTRLFETRSGKLSSLSVGLMFEGGYTVASTAALTDDSEDEDRIETRMADLGDLDLSGPYFKTSIVVRF